MDAKLFEVLGKYAGLAGLSIGLLLVLINGLLMRSIHIAYSAKLFDNSQLMV